MSSHSRGRLTLQSVTQYLPIDTINDALNLAHRFQEGETFKNYVFHRLSLVIPVGLLMLMISVACTVATMLVLGELHPLLVLAAIVLLPVILLGSLFVQAYLFFAWLESRALARALMHRAEPAHGAAELWLARFAGGLGTLPPVPWGLAAVVLFAPLVLLAFVVWKAALVLVVLAILAPVLFALLDR